jgi:hypothetical protein
MKPFAILFVIFCTTTLLLPNGSRAQSSTEAEPLAAQALEEKLEGTFKAEDVAAASSWVQSTGVVDWLGPLAPVALSPFFGITCLSGLAIWGPDWVTDNALLNASGPLKNSNLFIAFLVLTGLTSLPRLTKVSKPFAQAVDRLETYSVIIILLVIKVVASMQSEGAPPQVAMVQLGIISVTADTLLAFAMIANVLVINSVKFFFEFLVWLTPIPLVDAIFEVCNKFVCASLMAIYAFSPTLATVINLVVLMAAAIVLRWISRRVRFYRTMVLDPILAKLWSGFGQPRRPELIVFPRDSFGPFAAKSRLRITRANSDDGGLVLEEANWWMPAKKHVISSDHRAVARYGWTMHQVVLRNATGEESVLCFSRRYDQPSLEQVFKQLGLEVESTSGSDRQLLKYEFA